MENKIRININIAEKSYAIKIDQNKEALYREASKTLNDKLLQYRKAYKSNNDKEFLGMIAYGYLVKYLDNETKNDSVPEMSGLLKIDETLTARLENI